MDFKGFEARNHPHPSRMPYPKSELMAIAMNDRLDILEEQACRIYIGNNDYRTDRDDGRSKVQWTLRFDYPDEDVVVNVIEDGDSHWVQNICDGSILISRSHPGRPYNAMSLY